MYTCDLAYYKPVQKYCDFTGLYKLQLITNTIAS